MPAISPMAMRLIGKLTHFDVDFKEVAGLIEKDAILCSQLLKAVNSARYARRSTVDRVGDAVVLLGVGKLRKLALSFTVTNLFGRAKTATGWSPLRFNLHSAAVALMAEILAEHVPAANGEAAFIAALLHDVGKFAIAVNLAREYELIAELSSSSGRPIDECEREVLGFDHAELSGMMLARWQLPPYLQQAVFYHHRPAESAEASDGSVKLSQLLECADRFVRYLGIAVEPVDPDRLPEFSLELPGHELPSLKSSRSSRPSTRISPPSFARPYCNAATSVPVCRSRSSFTRSSACVAS